MQSATSNILPTMQCNSGFPEVIKTNAKYMGVDTRVKIAYVRIFPAKEFIKQMVHQTTAPKHKKVKTSDIASNESLYNISLRMSKKGIITQHTAEIMVNVKTFFGVFPFCLNNWVAHIQIMKSTIVEKSQNIEP